MNVLERPAMRSDCAAVLLILFAPVLAGCGGADANPQDKPPETAKPADRTKPADKTPAKVTAGGYDADALAKRIAQNMALLSPEDRKLAEAQKFCPVAVQFDEHGKPVGGFLGQIGKPVKMMAGDQAVFITCPNCKEDFTQHTDKYVQVLEKIRAGQGGEEK